MASSQLIMSVGDACDFARRWLGITEDLSGPDLGDVNYPRSIKLLNSRFGKLWHSKDHALRKVLNDPTCPFIYWNTKTSYFLRGTMKSIVSAW